MGIKERSSAQLRFLSEELKGSQCPLSPPTLVLTLATPTSYTSISSAEASPSVISYSFPVISFLRLFIAS